MNQSISSCARTSINAEASHLALIGNSTYRGEQTRKKHRNSLYVLPFDLKSVDVRECTCGYSRLTKLFRGGSFHRRRFDCKPGRLASSATI
eukprot:6214698-Pleurochrysis_carterae.AAC.5